jgi:hypothetical protein
MADRKAESGAIITGQESTAAVGTVSRLGGAGQIEADIRKVLSDGVFTTPVSGLTVRGRIINKALDLTTQVRNIFNKYGTDAHVYLPGIGTINGLTAGNWLDSAGTTPATLDGVVGKVDDATGTIDATQATTANKPFLRKGAVNLLTYSDDYTNVSWNKLNTTIPTAGRIQETAVSGFHAINKMNLTPVGVTATISIEAKAAERNYIRLSDGVTHTAVYNLSTGASSSVAGSPTDIRMTALADGWYRCSFTFVSASATSGWYLYLLQDATTLNYLGDITKGVSARKAQINLGTLADYAPTTSAAASNGVGNYAWEFDGSNDSLALGSVPFQMADDHCVVLGAYLNGSATLTCFGIADTALTAPSMRIRFSAGAPEYYLRDNALTTVDIISDTTKVNQPCVVTGRRVGVNAELRVNAEQKGNSTTVLGAATFSMAAIGARPFAGAIGEYWKGNIYPVIAIKGTVTDADRNILEKFVGSLSGVNI